METAKPDFVTANAHDCYLVDAYIAADLYEALDRARDHLRFNAWKGDPNNEKRLRAVQEIEAALAAASQQHTTGGE